MVRVISSAEISLSKIEIEQCGVRSVFFDWTWPRAALERRPSLQSHLWVKEPCFRQSDQSRNLTTLLGNVFFYSAFCIDQLDIKSILRA